MVSNCDQAVFGLACLLQTMAEGKQEKESIAIAAKQFSGYFQEFGSKVNENDFHMELILRNIDQPHKLIFYLQQLPKQTLQVLRLTERLINSFSNPDLLGIYDLGRK